MQSDQRDRRELRHEPEPGYRTAFFIAFAAALAYLTVIFVRTL